MLLRKVTLSSVQDEDEGEKNGWSFSYTDIFAYTEPSMRVGVRMPDKRELYLLSNKYETNELIKIVNTLTFSSGKSAF